MASTTALVYDEEMMNYRLLWDDPECAIEVPERLSSSYERLQHYDLVQRCVGLPVREATEEEITLVHSTDYLEIVKSTQTMNEEELKKTSQNYVAAYFHQNSYRCAKLALGGTLQLVDAVLSGQVLNGMALVRPPGHHSQRSQSNGFCIFNNVAIAAKYAQKKYKLERILIVDWDIHHGQGIQYVFEDDPSVLYFSWHRYEHGSFWPNLGESDFGFVGKDKGTGFNINLPWNKTGMGNADYIAAFLHVLLPIAYEFDPELVLVSSGYDSGIGDPEGCMRATPECFSHLTHMLMNLTGGKLCVVLEGGYHLRSLAESVCMTVRTLLGDAVSRLSGEMAPCHSALESIQNVRAAHAPYWHCFSPDDAHLVHKSNTAGSPPEPPQEGRDASVFEVFLETHMKEVLNSTPAIRTSAVIPEGHTVTLPAGVQVEDQTASKEQTDVIIGDFSELLKTENVLTSLGKMLTVINKLVNKQIRNAIALSPNTSLSAAVVLQHALHVGLQRVFYIHIGDLDSKPLLKDDGKTFFLRILGDEPAEVINSKYQHSLKWGENSCEGSSFIYVLLRLILPIAYSFQPDLILVAAGSNRSIGIQDISLLTSMLQGLAEGRMLAVIPESESDLAVTVSSSLMGFSRARELGPHKCPSVDCMKTLKVQLDILQKEWKMLQCSFG
ncbi:polyamine deacetylase HDAC10 [Spea bombifrons]|uniref:polyamine deacetylase HDAC10 n=1 Tax=Spea bombifrons TaxID=233779 RepID=UPI00234B688B|nr:polyamine deacetylase HDAC10 [Spea bombifrons]XP_053318401.1 polyamine deacetylase HDAC10 [Spea bombifrons]